MSRGHLAREGVSSVDRCATLVCQLICDTWSAGCGMGACSGVVPGAAVAPIAARTDVLNVGAIRSVIACHSG